MRSTAILVAVSSAFLTGAGLGWAGDAAKAAEWARRGHDLWKVNKSHAIDAFTRALREDAAMHSARYNRALLYVETDRAEEAMRDLKALEQARAPEAEKLRGLLTLIATAHTSIAEKALEDEDYALAFEKLRVVLVYDPGYADAYTVRGVVYARQGHEKKALADYDRAIELDPKSPEPVHNRGLLRLRRGEPVQALRDFTRAIELEPQEPSGYRGRAEAHRALGDEASARRDDEQADRLEGAGRQP
jgi:tetratricopeptide (TPR) repeat protein